MGAHEPTVVHIGSDQDVDELIEQLPAMENGHVVVSVHDDSTMMLTAAEFSRILNAARAANVSMSISTGDHLRRELARMLGWTVVGHRYPAAAGSEWTHDKPSTEEHSTADLATYAPVQFPAVEREQQKGAPRRRTATGTIVLDPEETASETQPAQETEKPTSRTQPSPARPTGSEDASHEEDAAPSGRRRKAILAGAIVAPLVVLAVVAGIAYYLLPSATVTLVPKEHVIAADLTYGLTAPGESFDITAEPTPVSHTVVVDRVAQATGERFEPDGVAVGEVLLTNPYTTPIEVPAKTELMGYNGLTYLTQKAVTVPAADPFGSLSFGSATVPIAASGPGPDFNTEAGTIVGQLDSGVYFRNSAAVDGGTMKRIPVVTEADIAALKEAAKKDLQARADPEFTAQIDPSLALVPGSVKHGEPVLQFSHQPGWDGPEFSVHGTLEVTGKVFDPAKLHAQARDEAGRRLASQAGPDEILLADTVTVSDPVATNDEQTAFKIHTEATMRAVVTDEERKSLATELAGKDWSEAEQLIQAMPDVASYQIDITPTWLPKRMPQLDNRIDVAVGSKEQINANP